MAKHYDVAVLGGGIGALASAALLARRSWRVLLVGNGYRSWRYTYDGLPLARRPFTLHAGASPALGRIFAELAQTQTYQRRARVVDPSVQVIANDFRFEVPRDAALLGKEVEREFSSVRRVVDDLVAETAATTAAADAAFREDVLWPPRGFWERRETERVFATLPRARDGGEDLFAELEATHPYRAVVSVPAAFASDVAGTLPPFALVRLHGEALRGLTDFPRGEDDLVELFAERIRAHGGEIAMHERAAKLVTKGSRVTGVELAGEGAAAGVQFVVGEMPGMDLLRLATTFEPSRRALGAMTTVTPLKRRFVVSMLVRASGLPELLARDSYLLVDDGESVHLQRHAVDDELVLLIAETLLDLDVPVRICRERVLRAVERYLPFVEQHYLLVDSPHDGRALWDFRKGKRVEVERALLRGAGGPVDAEPMVAQIAANAERMHGLAGDDLRTPLSNAFVVGRTCMPALGQEGELLAAWGVARIITRTDRRKEKMRREMWSKVELR